MELILGSASPRRRELLERMGLNFRVLTADIDETKYESEDPEASVRRICQAKAAAVAERLKRENSQFSIFNSQLVLTADTIVVLDGKILGKPHSEDEARAMLAALSGQEHAVYTAFTLLPAAGMHDANCKMQDEATGNREQAIGDGGCGDAKLGPSQCAHRLAMTESEAGPAAGNAADAARHLSPATCHLSPAASAAFTHCEKTFVKFRKLTEAEIAAYVATGEPMDKAGAYGIQGLGALLVEGIRGDYFTVMGLPLCRLAVALKQYGIDPLRYEA